MSKIFCFGEVLLRLSPALNGEWIDKAMMPVYVGGAELNVATALARWELPVKYGSALPGNYLSQEIIRSLKEKDIDISSILLCGERIGTYYLPQGADLKSAGVIYDRAGSSFAGLKTGMIDWNEALKDCTWFHFSAISPGLNQQVALVCQEGIMAAKARDLTISVDLNYRPKLWQYGQHPKDVMPALVEHSHIIMGNIWAAESLLGIAAPVKSSEGKSKQELIDAAGRSMLQLHQRYPSATGLAYTFRLSQEYWSVLQHGGESVVSRQLPVGKVMDKAGSGDCFMAGLIYGLNKGHALQLVADFAAAAAVGKLQEAGDTTRQTVEMIRSKLEQA